LASTRATTGSRSSSWSTPESTGTPPRWRGEFGSAKLRAAVTLHFPTRAERTGKQPHIASLQEQVWPEFMYHDAVLDRLFGRVVAEYPEFLFYAWDDEPEEVVGGGHAIPAAWDGVIANLPDRVCRAVGPQSAARHALGDGAVGEQLGHAASCTTRWWRCSRSGRLRVASRRGSTCRRHRARLGARFGTSSVRRSSTPGLRR